MSFPATSNKLVRQSYENDNITIHIIGFPKLIGDLLEGIGDIFLFAVVTLVITFILLYIYTRDLRATVAPLFCSVLAVVWQLGLLHLAGLRPQRLLHPGTFPGPGHRRQPRGTGD